MASSEEYLTFIADQLSECPLVRFRPMMGEYILYLDNKVVGGIYDDRLLIKATPSVKALRPDGKMEIPYPGGKPMLLAEDPENREALAELLTAAYGDLFLPEKK